MAAPASLNHTSIPTTSLNKKLATSPDSTPSDDQLRSMEAPLHVDTPLWNVSSPEERRELLKGDTVMAGQSASTESIGPTPRQAVIEGDGHRWPGGVVPYVLDPNLTLEERQEVLDGIDLIESQTNVSFVPLPDNDGDGVPDGGAPANFIRFEGSTRSESNIGMQQGEQVILTSTDPVRPNGQNGAGTVAHEIMHALGFYHEHQHPDANNPGNPVTVVPGNNPAPNFNQLPPGAIILPYDPDSIMHYETGNFNGGAINVNPGANVGGVGQRHNLSPGDIASINEIYPAGGGKTIPLGNGYTLHLENQDSAWSITDAEGNTVRVWGDPHVDENSDGSDDWDFTQTSTFVLDDGTKITVGTRDVGEGRTVTDSLTITNGDRAISVTGIADNNVQVDSSQTNGDPAEGGQSIDAAVDDGDIFLEGDGVNQWERPQPPV